MKLLETDNWMYIYNFTFEVKTLKMAVSANWPSKTLNWLQLRGDYRYDLNVGVKAKICW